MNLYWKWTLTTHVWSWTHLHNYGEVRVAFSVFLVYQILGAEDSISTSSVSESHAHCSFCKSDFSVANGGRTDVLKHIGTDSHQKKKNSVTATKCNEIYTVPFYRLRFRTSKHAFDSCSQTMLRLLACTTFYWNWRLRWNRMLETSYLAGRLETCWHVLTLTIVDK